MGRRWLPDDIEMVATMLREDKSCTQIGEALGVSRNAVIGIVHRNQTLAAIGFSAKVGAEFRKPKPTRVPAPPKLKVERKPANYRKWSRSELDRLAAMLAAGKSSRVIGEAFGVSKNVIIGLVRRRDDLREIGLRSKSGPKTGHAAVPASPQVAARPAAAFVGRPLALIGPHECKWPVNDAAWGELHLFCGAPAVGPYCVGHARLAVGAGTRSERAVAPVVQHTGKVGR